ncbi:MAG: hypothetical protein QE283_06945 [Rhodoferax sp.]|nr:hypothetical protein [Rhodoferax sp.]
MGGWLARLKNENTGGTHATKPAKPKQGEGGAGFVGFVAYSPNVKQKIGVLDPATETPRAPAASDGVKPEAALVGDRDRWCWPYSAAWDSNEIETFMARLAQFTDKGVSYDDTERLLDELVIRDREGDDRRLCLECTQLQGAGSWRCGNWLAAGIAHTARDAQLPCDLVRTLQRCDGFCSKSGGRN